MVDCKRQSLKSSIERDGSNGRILYGYIYEPRVEMKSTMGARDGNAHEETRCRH